jgi:alcohol dehydrogenase class IV
MILGTDRVDPGLYLTELHALARAISALASEAKEETIDSLACVAVRMTAELLALTEGRLNPSQAREFRKLAERIIGSGHA